MPFGAMERSEHYFFPAQVLIKEGEIGRSRADLRGERRDIKERKREKKDGFHRWTTAGSYTGLGTSVWHFTAWYDCFLPFL